MKCETCNKTFSRKDALEKHVKAIHEAIREFKCDVCEKEFTQVTHFKIHFTNVHDTGCPVLDLFIL